MKHVTKARRSFPRSQFWSQFCSYRMSCTAFKSPHHVSRVLGLFDKTCRDYEFALEADGRWQMQLRQVPIAAAAAKREQANIGYEFARNDVPLHGGCWVDGRADQPTYEEGLAAMDLQTFGRSFKNGPSRGAAAAENGVDWSSASSRGLQVFCNLFGLGSRIPKAQAVIAVTEFSQSLGIELQPAWFASRSGPDVQVVDQVRKRMRQRSAAHIAALIQARQGQPWCDPQLEVPADFGPLLIADGRSGKRLLQLLSIMGGAAGRQMELADVYKRYALAAAEEEPFRKQQLLAGGVATGPGPEVDQAVFDVNGLTDVTADLLTAAPRLIRLDTAFVLNAPVNCHHFLSNKAGNGPAGSVPATLHIANAISPSGSVLLADICGFVSKQPWGGIRQLMEKHQPRQAVQRLTSLGEQGIRRVFLATGEASKPLELGLKEQERGYTIKVRGVRVSLLFAPPGGEDWMMIVIHAYHPFNAQTDFCCELTKQLALAASIFTGRYTTWPEVEAVLSAV